MLAKPSNDDQEYAKASHMHFAVFIDAMVFRMIRAAIRLVNASFDFDATDCARILFALYLVAVLIALVRSATFYQAFLPLAVLVVSTVPRIERPGRPRKSLEHDKRSRILRLVIASVFLVAIVVDAFSEESRWIPANVIWPILVYVLDLDSLDKGERRLRLPIVYRVVDNAN
jgi:hypothetical protein